MQLTTLVVSAFSAALLLAPAAAQSDRWRFKLRLLTYRGAEPVMSAYVDVVDGVAGFNRSGAAYPGFVNWMPFNPATGALPTGPLNAEQPVNPTPGYLVPTKATGQYQLKFGTKREAGALAKNKFAITELSCGAQCGGLQVVYGDKGKRAWIVVPDEKHEGGWKLVWYRGDESALPKGAIGVWLTREQSYGRVDNTTSESLSNSVIASALHGVRKTAHIPAKLSSKSLHEETSPLVKPATIP
ncbi:hypothetical protein EDC01DRAFT_732800 [Geopyxis carbonaria]|nr:hypothetical protein EDC01DRAFT_732800 [Geopyxis carbonaria]